MTFFETPAKYWTFDAIASHYCYYEDNVCRILDYIKKDLKRRAMMEDRDAQKAKQFLGPGWTVCK